MTTLADLPLAAQDALLARATRLVASDSTKLRLLAYAARAYPGMVLAPGRDRADAAFDAASRALRAGRA